jgi:dnd system-associated protein 4
MADRRINVPKKHEDFVQKLTRSATTSGPFETQADVIAFAAAWGARHGAWTEIEIGSRDPIRPEVFNRSKLDTLIYLLAFCRTKDVKVLANNDEMEEERASVFEGYAQAGLDLLELKLRGEVDYTEAILTQVKIEAVQQGTSEEEIDIRSLLSD